jgi:hypothetical protein
VLTVSVAAIDLVFVALHLVKLTLHLKVVMALLVQRVVPMINLLLVLEAYLVMIQIQKLIKYSKL